MELKEFSKEFIRNSHELNLELSERKIEQFYKYMELLKEWNEKINLTAITENKDIIVKHFIDSLTIAKYIKDNDSIIDVGTGAGFPGIPLKIFNENIRITLLDSLNKRTIFLRDVVDKLGLEDVEIIHGRAEDFAHNNVYRGTFDYAVSRAVAPLNVLLEYLVPYTKIGGCVIAMKGSNACEEIVEAQNAISKLRTHIEKNEKVYLPDDCGERCIVILKKDGETNNMYPRKAGTPKKNPL